MWSILGFQGVGKPKIEKIAILVRPSLMFSNEIETSGGHISSTTASWEVPLGFLPSRCIHYEVHRKSSVFYHPVNNPYGAPPRGEVLMCPSLAWTGGHAPSRACSSFEHDAAPGTNTRMGLLGGSLPRRELIQSQRTWRPCVCVHRASTALASCPSLPA